MSIRENEIRKDSFKFKAEEIVLAVDMIEKLEKTIEVVYYLMEYENVESFVLILMTAEDIDLGTLFNHEKRDADILFEINKEEETHLLLCQDTKIDGGYHFAERIIRNILSKGGKNVYCAEIEVRSTKHPIKTVIFKLIKTFMKTQEEKKRNQIVYKSLN